MNAQSLDQERNLKTSRGGKLGTKKTVVKQSSSESGAVINGMCWEFD